MSRRKKKICTVRITRETTYIDGCPFGFLNVLLDTRYAAHRVLESKVSSCAPDVKTLVQRYYGHGNNILATTTTRCRMLASHLSDVYTCARSNHNDSWASTVHTSSLGS